MSEKKRIEKPEDLVNAVDDLIDQMLMHTPEEADEILREAGYDPDDIGRKMENIALQAMASSPINWQQRAQKEMEQAKAKLVGIGPKKRLPRKELLMAIDSFRSSLSGQKLAAAFFRNFEDASDDELADILAELEFLAQGDEDVEE